MSGSVTERVSAWAAIADGRPSMTRTTSKTKPKRCYVTVICGVVVEKRGLSSSASMNAATSARGVVAVTG
jgi:hypothetical protein